MDLAGGPYRILAPRIFLASAMRTGSLLSLLLLAAWPLQAQDDPTRRLVATHLGTADGLPQGLVSQMIQDRSGYLWMGTKDGLARYDGYSFTVFRNDEADSTSIIGNHITALVEDRDGLIWVGTQRRGICRLATSSAWPSPARSCTARRSCSSTSQPRAWTR